MFRKEYPVRELNKIIYLQFMQEDSNKKRNKYTTFCWVIAITIALWLLSIPILCWFFPNINERGSFGDSFGVINALFSGGALAGVVYAIILQKKELRLQRKELEYTRAELKRLAEAQEKSEQALSKQAASLKATAKLNGLSAILQYYGTLLEAQATGRYNINDGNYYKVQAEQIKKQIENIIADK